MNHKFTNKFFLKIPNEFLLEYKIEENILIKWVEKYINNYYLQNKQKTYKVNMNNDIFNSVIFHKIELSDNNKSPKKSKRVRILILLNKPNWINTIFPIFVFSTQEEKKYTTKLLHTKDFVYKVFRDFEKYRWWLDSEWNKLSEGLWKEINI